MRVPLSVPPRVLALWLLLGCLALLALSVASSSCGTGETGATPVRHPRRARALLQDTRDNGLSSSSNSTKGNDCDPSKAWPCSNNVIGSLLLIVFFGAILAYGAKMISDGSEMLLDVWNQPGFIGGFLLPVLGAIPDAAIIVVSGALGSKEEAQEQLSVGVGTLAGSTIMLLTISYFGSMVLGRCDLQNDGQGEAIDKVLTKGWSPTKTGITVDKDVRVNAFIAMGTSLLYFLIQGIAFEYQSSSSDVAAPHEKNWALATFILCLVALAGYSVYQVMNSSYQEKLIKLAHEQEQEKLRVRQFLAKNSNMAAVVSAFRTKPETPQERSTLLQHTYGNKWLGKVRASRASSSDAAASNSINAAPVENSDSDSDSEQSPEEPKWKIWMRIVLYIGIGLAIVSFFSDPMVDVISNFGGQINVGGFYVSFVITPFCSNASELISSLVFAAKKKRSNSTLTFSQLFGACTMNNTLCLGIFVLLVYARGLAWNFSAEVLAIFIVIVLVACMSLRQTLKFWKAWPILSLYPLSILLVYLLETFADWK
mgnify:CR=1 FL=1